MMTVVVLISSNSEWSETKRFFEPSAIASSKLGEWFETKESSNRSLVFFHGGWGKIPAAASAQYAIDRWQPSLIINLGSCGGIEQRTRLHEMIVAERTVVYDIVERMGDAREALLRFATDLDVSWMSRLSANTFTRGVIASADKDLHCEDVAMLHTEFGAIAADWESGAIAYVCRKNEVTCVILRAVSDLVGVELGTAHGKPEVYHAGVREVMPLMLQALPEILACFD